MKLTYLDSPLRRSLVLGALGGLAAPALPAFAQGEAWPKAKPIRMLNGFTAGSATDVIARAVAPELARLTGAAAVIVENRPGQGGAIAAAQLVQSPADGYTLFITSSAHAVNPAFFPNLPYDTLKDIAVVGPVGASMFVMVTSASSRFHTVADVVAYAKAHPGKLNYASGGVGSGSHLNSAKLVAVTGIDVVHIPSRGTPEGLTETLAERVDWMFAPAPAVMSLLRDGKLRALAVGPAVRSSVLPGIPSMAEAGFPSAAYTSWVGVFISAKTPKSITTRLSSALAEAVAGPAIKDLLLSLGTEPMPMNATEFGKFVESEVHSMATLVKLANIKPNE
jgi:tripartite-type tricarboxylate transporter receptor subunit TctC